MIDSFKHLLIKLIASLLNYILYFFKRILAYRQHSMLSKCGSNVYIGNDCKFTLKNINCGYNIYIGDGASFISSISTIYIGNYVLFGPNVTIRGGNHRLDVIGRYMYDIKEEEKLSENDQDVIIEDDVWIGCNVTILKGVTIGRGSVVAAGAVVTKSCAPYSIIGGNPARLIKMRFTNREIIQHEKILYGRNCEI